MPREERRAVRRQEHRQRPAARAPRQQRVRGLVDLVEVRPLLAVDLDVDERVVHHRGDGRILERLVRHHVAPVARRVADRQQDRLVLAPRARERLLAPRIPVDRIVGVLPQVGARGAGETIGHDASLRRGRESRAGAATSCVGQLATRRKFSDSTPRTRRARNPPPRCTSLVSGILRSGPAIHRPQHAARIERARRHDQRRRLARASPTSSSAGIGGSSANAMRHAAARRSTCGVPGQSASDSASSPCGVERHARHVAQRACARRRARRRAGRGTSDSGVLSRRMQRRVAPLVVALPALPRPVALGLFPVAVVVGQRAQRLQVLRALERQAAERILAVERAAADAEVGGRHAAGRQLAARALRGIGVAPRQLVPVRVEMRQQRGAAFDRRVVAELQLRRARRRRRAASAGRARWWRACPG